MCLNVPKRTKGKIMAYRSKVSLVVLLLGSVSLASCSTPSATPSNSPSPSVAPTVEPTDSYESEILLANNELEEEFLQIALASCELTKTKSLQVYDLHGDGTTITYFRPSDNLLLAENQVSENHMGELLPTTYVNNLPMLFYPCLLEEQAALVEDPNAELLEHTVEKLSPNRYAWSQHQGGANLETIYFDVSDGLISTYSKELNSAIKTEVSYEEFGGDLAQYFINAYGY